jgi:hypothetical protein
MNYRTQSGEVGSIRLDNVQYNVYIITYGTMLKTKLRDDTVYCLKDFCPIDGLLTDAKMPAFITIPGDKKHLLYVGYITNDGKVCMPKEMRKTVSIARTPDSSRKPYVDGDETGLPAFDFNTFVASINVDYAEYTKTVDTYLQQIEED